ncbi:uncharacterized protein PSFLO_01971 [Pseudozyma flocculosa]|uniref:Uncharacterized protein n=1 Tax=Pseudozyma flocculosa TaxID=84751 RepID=A0A5C3EXB2_9BASI|nr:uncharacterized protein PSFLO_01971 [Pseudozyma flocculosa]
MFAVGTGPGCAKASAAWGDNAAGGQRSFTCRPLPPPRGAAYQIIELELRFLCTRPTQAGLVLVVRPSPTTLSLSLSRLSEAELPIGVALQAGRQGRSASLLDRFLAGRPPLVFGPAETLFVRRKQIWPMLATISSNARQRAGEVLRAAAIGWLFCRGGEAGVDPGREPTAKPAGQEQASKLASQAPEMRRGASGFGAGI